MKHMIVQAQHIINNKQKDKMSDDDDDDDASIKEEEKVFNLSSLKRKLDTL